MANIRLSDELLTAALSVYEQRVSEIDEKIVEIRRMLGDGTDHAAVPTENGRRTRKFSAASRRKMAMAQQLRWKKINEAAESPQTESSKPKKRKMSAAG